MNSAGYSGRNFERLDFFCSFDMRFDLFFVQDATTYGIFCLPTSNIFSKSHGLSIMN
jgi:hypothetical protein